MRVLGIDTSSSCAGHALVEDGDRLVAYGVWKPTKQEDKLKGTVRLFAYYKWLNAWIGLRKDEIDMIAIETLSVTRGVKVVRILSEFEAAAKIAAKRQGFMVVVNSPGVARNLVLGISVNASKDDALAELRRQRPHIKFPPKNQGGEDVQDAYIQAVAGPMSVSQ